MADNVHNNVKNAATILLYSVANADQNIEKDEIKIIKDIVQDFFSLNLKRHMISLKVLL